MTLERLNQKIIKANKKLVKAERELEKSIKRRITPLALKDVKQKVAEERRATYLLISKKLELTNEDYRNLAKSQNCKYLNGLTFKKYKESAGIFISAVNVFKGFINTNGRFYCEGDYSIRAPFISVVSPLLFSLLYPSRMEGNIDCLGNISLKVVSYGFALFNTMPEEFEAEVSEDGFIRIITKKRPSDFFQNHRYIIHKIVSSFAFDSETESAQFFDTRGELIKLVEEERARL